jgi:hypothetical protein
MSRATSCCCLSACKRQHVRTRASCRGAYRRGVSIRIRMTVSILLILLISYPDDNGRRGPQRKKGGKERRESEAYVHRPVGWRPRILESTAMARGGGRRESQPGGTGQCARTHASTAACRGKIEDEEEMSVRPLDAPRARDVRVRMVAPRFACSQQSVPYSIPSNRPTTTCRRKYASMRLDFSACTRAHRGRHVSGLAGSDSSHAEFSFQQRRLQAYNTAGRADADIYIFLTQILLRYVEPSPDHTHGSDETIKRRRQPFRARSPGQETH